MKTCNEHNKQARYKVMREGKEQYWCDDCAWISYENDLDDYDHPIKFEQYLVDEDIVEL